MSTNDELKNKTANGTNPVLVADAAEKPTMEKYGYHTQCGFDDLPSGWMIEGGEEAYYEALKKWEEANGIWLKQHEENVLKQTQEQAEYLFGLTHNA